MDEVRFFDPKQPYSSVRKALPHWSQAGTLTFITWRTGDSLPAAAQRRIAQARQAELTRLGLNTLGEWRSQLSKLPAARQRQLQWHFFSSLDVELDRGCGACVLAKPALSMIVEEALLCFDGERYVLADFVVMPNHVHVLAAFRDEDALLRQCTAWKRYTAGRIQKALGQRGEFWQVEQFDHLVRNAAKGEQLRRYIAENPRKAHLAVGAYRHYSAP